MEVQYLILARYAETLPDGGLQVIGGNLDMLTVAEVPYAFPSLCLTSRVSFDREDALVSHDISFRVTDPDGEPIAETKLGTTPEHTFSPNRDRLNVNATVLMMNLLLAKEGIYRFEVIVDNSPAKSTPLRVELQSKDQSQSDASAGEDV